ncbi:DNA primase-helicase subunit [Vibrio phage nt-1]|uniref:DnaB-like replicative helicase n=1 Tax=Vibrio phage nt-1 TaxID=115992 RepID=R9TI89_9CAUD|nr:DNA primase-helicase subunit [Vibrio phage nt-1]AGN30060.2 DNA primase-helicase subunit [Vibrio phage nt-1]
MMIKNHADEYKRRATPEVLKVCLESLTSISEYDYAEIQQTINELDPHPSHDLRWMIDETEKFCVEQSVFNALTESIAIQDNASKPLDQRNKKMKSIGAIPDLMRDALNVCFDTSVGHDYFADWEPRYKSYIEKAAKIPFKMNILNKITQGGVERSTLNLLLAGSNVGKSLALCHLATEYLLQGYNVLYISMEMSEAAVSKRIDANLMDISMDDFDTITEKTYGNKIQNLEKKTQGKLFIKQFPTAGANVTHFNTLMNELRTKKNVVPDVVIVDYLGICASSRVSSSENTYVHVKAIAEEVRGFAVEHNVAVWSAAQTTRNAWDASDMGMGDIAESAGLAHTADLILGIMETEETVALGQQRVKQIKSRYADRNQDQTFMIAVNKGKQRWGDVDGTANYKAPAQSQTQSSSPFAQKKESTQKTEAASVNW